MGEHYTLPPHTITSGPEEWSNGHIVYQFEFAGVPFKLMQRLCKKPEDEEYTYLHVEDHRSDGDRFMSYKHPWLHQYPPTFPGTVTVETAVQLLNMAKSYYERGAEHGYANAQADIRKAIGIK